jgi:hypothetical protein
MELIVAYSRYYPNICIKFLRKITNDFMVANVPAQVLTEYFLNTSLEHYRNMKMLSKTSQILVALIITLYTCKMGRHRS